MNAAVGDDRRDERGRRDVERGIVGADIGWRRRYVAYAPHLVRLALLDDDLISAGGRGIHCRPWRGDDKGHLVVARRDGEAIRPDLVGNVAVRRDPVRANDAEIDAAL